MSKVAVRLLKPLNGLPEGAETEFDAHEVEQLEGYGAIERVAASVQPMAVAVPVSSEASRRGGRREPVA